MNRRKRDTSPLKASARSDFPNKHRPSEQKKFVPDLNALVIPLADGTTVPISKGRTRSHGDARCEVVFSNIKQALLTEIRKAKRVYGCMAWMTDFDVIDALAQKEEVSVIVHKQNFLSGSECWSDLKRRLDLLPPFAVPLPATGYEILEYSSRVEQPGQPPLQPDNPDERWTRLWVNSDNGTTVATYRREALRPVPLTESNVLQEDDDGNPVFHLLGYSRMGGKEVEAVRCAGLSNSDERSPRMHHKFFVFVDGEDWWVWTGSFNATTTASYSLENAMVIRSKEIAKSYLAEWQRVACISEPR
jgi:hypothetical protein